MYHGAFWYTVAVNNKDETPEYPNYRAAPQVALGEIRLLWHSDYWDGPRSGMLVYNRQTYWFDVCEESDEESDEPYYCRFVIIALSAEQMQDEAFWHDLFRKNVGTNTDYDVNGRQANGIPRPQEMWPAFYEPYKKRAVPNYTQNPIIAWFESGPGEMAYR